MQLSFKAIYTTHAKRLAVAICLLVCSGSHANGELELTGILDIAGRPPTFTIRSVDPETTFSFSLELMQTRRGCQVIAYDIARKQVTVVFAGTKRVLSMAKPDAHDAIIFNSGLLRSDGQPVYPEPPRQLVDQHGTVILVDAKTGRLTKLDGGDYDSRRDEIARTGKGSSIDALTQEKADIAAAESLTMKAVPLDRFSSLTPTMPGKHSNRVNSGFSAEEKRMRTLQVGGATRLGPNNDPEMIEAWRAMIIEENPEAAAILATNE